MCFVVPTVIICIAHITYYLPPFSYFKCEICSKLLVFFKICLNTMNYNITKFSIMLTR